MKPKVDWTGVKRKERGNNHGKRWHCQRCDFKSDDYGLYVQHDLLRVCGTKL